MQLSEKAVGDVTVAAITGSIDAVTADQLLKWLRAHIQDGRASLVADMSGVDFMSSAGLRALLATLKDARAKGGDLRLAGPTANVEKILRTSGFTNILRLFATVDQAVASFAA